MNGLIARIGSAAVISVAVLTALALDRHGGLVSGAVAGEPKAPDSTELCPRGNATLRGAYMSIGGGTVPGLGPVAFVGRITYDGKGKVTNPFTVSFAGTIQRAVAEGTYTVNGDCSGSLTLAGSQHYDFVVHPDGSKLDYIETDAGTIISGSATRMQN